MPEKSGSKAHPFAILRSPNGADKLKCHWLEKGGLKLEAKKRKSDAVSIRQIAQALQELASLFDDHIMLRTQLINDHPVYAPVRNGCEFGDALAKLRTLGLGADSAQPSRRAKHRLEAIRLIARTRMERLICLIKVVAYRAAGMKDSEAFVCAAAAVPVKAATFQAARIKAQRYFKDFVAIIGPQTKQTISLSYGSGPAPSYFPRDFELWRMMPTEGLYGLNGGPVTLERVIRMERLVERRVVTFIRYAGATGRHPPERLLDRISKL